VSESGDSMPNERYELVVSVSNKSLPLEQRIAALFRLLDLDPELALHAALRVAEDPTEEPETLRAMGSQLNIIGSGHRYPTEFEIRDMCDIANDAYCDPGSSS
jgi:hypothetical protein